MGGACRTYREGLDAVVKQQGILGREEDTPNQQNSRETPRRVRHEGGNVRILGGKLERGQAWMVRRVRSRVEQPAARLPDGASCGALSPSRPSFQ